MPSLFQSHLKVLRVGYIIKRIGMDLSKTNLSYIESLTTRQRTITNSDTELHQFHKMTTKN